MLAHGIVIVDVGLLERPKHLRGVAALMAEKAVAVGGSRLHAGFHTADPRRNLWAGSGFYVANPRTVVEAYRCSKPHGEGLLARVVDALSLNNVCLRLIESPPRHHGFGSTTQILLAGVAAAAALNGERPDLATWASRLGRGRFSWVGTLLAVLGGFVVDAGSRGKPAYITRLAIPEEWRFVIALPRVSRGLDEDEEAHVMRYLAPPGPLEERLMAAGTLRMATGIALQDLDAVLEGLKAVQLGTGRLFSKAQGGVYRGPLARLVEEAERNGITMAQSSWGPVLYTISEKDMARSDANMLKSIMSELGLEGGVIVSEPLNTGIKVHLV